MAGSFVAIVVEGGSPSLRCPVTGRVVFHEGFDSDAEHSPHLRFFIDWIGQKWVADPRRLEPEQAALQRELMGILEAEPTFETQNDMVAAVVARLPPSAFVIELLDPPQGSSDGEICYACFDFAPLAEGPVSLKLVASEADD